MEVLFKKYLKALILALMVTVITVVYVVPTALTVARVYKESGERKGKIEKLRKKVAALESMDKANIKERVEKLSYYLPSSKDVSLLLEAVSQTTSETGLFFENLSLAPGEISTESAVKVTLDAASLDVSVTLSGSISELLNFLGRVDKASPVMRIKSLSVEKKTKAVETATPRDYSFLIILVTFYKPLPQTIGSIASEIKPVSYEDEAFIDKLPSIKKSYGGMDSGLRETGGKADPFSKF